MILGRNRWAKTDACATPARAYASTARPPTLPLPSGYQNLMPGASQYIKTSNSSCRRSSTSTRSRHTSVASRHIKTNYSPCRCSIPQSHRSFPQHPLEIHVSGITTHQTNHPPASQAPIPQVHARFHSTRSRYTSVASQHLTTSHSACRRSTPTSNRSRHT